MKPEDVVKLIDKAIAEERQRTCRLLLEFAEERRKALDGHPDDIVRLLASIGNELPDPDRR